MIIDRRQIGTSVFPRCARTNSTLMIVKHLAAAGKNH
jgi:hypothetical protein